ncbi:bilirubin oxidase [Geomonas sp. Red32]|uniref:bilirubin oxidase n=1 Tax=Geomonas sp. Red32 TaxID=2912856 RepID=UPI00202CB9ED|nr:bilirubin oxidase [Geomonas sp. Red32]MCM0084074.1 bilirubin oxidase [Geomonas sp. Red32]
MVKTATLIRLALFTALLTAAATGAEASTLVPQTWLPGQCIPQFSVPLPTFGPAGIAPRVQAASHPFLAVKMKEVEVQSLPDGMTVSCPALDPTAQQPPTVTFNPTRVWAYETSDAKTGKVLGPANWPAVSIDATRNIPTTIKYVNVLPSFNFSNSQPANYPFSPGLVQGLVTVDQTIDWANPEKNTCSEGVNCVSNPGDPCCRAFTGSPPTVPHMHGAEVFSAFDGGPEGWFTADGRKGRAYGSLFDAGPGSAVYVYNNTQEPGTLWFHDHTLGATRDTVFAGGLAGFFLLRDQKNEPKNLPSGAYEVEMALQDRLFDTNSQLFFPDGSGPVDATGNPLGNLNGPPTNPDIHPYWIPEFIGDVAIVNGRPWPFMNVEPRRYRLRLLDASNARVFNLAFGNAVVYQIGADDNYLDRPVPVTQVKIAPGERVDLIVDFSKLAGKTITVTNDAPVPYPDGLYPVPYPDPANPGQMLPADQPQMASIMQFRVGSHAVADNSCRPATGECKRQTPMVRLTDGHGHLAPAVKIDRKRQLVLKEFEGPGGPVEVMLNNSDFNGLKNPSIASFPDGVTEQPRIGSTELWEIINLTADAHPIHTHLVQPQILNRQAYDVDRYLGTFDANGNLLVAGAWTKAFGHGPVALPAGCQFEQYCPNYGPPLPYGVLNADGALGGNPAITPFLVGKPMPPEPGESGYKDTIRSMPGEVLRLVIRWAPTTTPVGRSMVGVNLYPFDATGGPGYVWHCHILDHEDNEMMRPYNVKK